MTEPLVSVVVPCHNAAPFVADAVGSALAQGDAVGEVVLVDDGSADATLGVLRQLADEANAGRPGLVRVVAQANGGAPSARNAGLALCTGAFVQFLDADDVLAPGKVARQAALAEADGADLVAGAYSMVPLGADDAPSPCPVVTSDAWCALIRGQLGLTSANLFQRSAVEAVGGWDEALPNNQDYDLMARLLQAGATVAFDTEPGATVRSRAESVWRRDPNASNRGWIELLARIIDHLRDTGSYTADREFEADRRMYMALQLEAARSPRFSSRMHSRYVSDRFDLGRVRTGPLYGRLYRAAGFGTAEAYRRIKGRVWGALGKA